MALSIHPAWSPGLLLLLFVMAAALVVYLYHAQQRIASRGVVHTLTAIRIILLLLLLAVLLQPALRWTRSTTTAGTLWLLLDDSQSMTMTDPQANPLERLRWSDALGLLPDGLRASRVDFHAAHLAALRQEFLALRPAAWTLDSLGAPGDAAAVQKFAAALETWQRQYQPALAELTRDPAARSLPAVLHALQMAETMVAADRGAAAGQSNLRAASGVVRWSYIQNNMDAGLRDLGSVADRVDDEFLRTHGTDSDVQAALAQVGKMSRAELTYRLLTATAKRTAKNLSDLVGSYQFRLAIIGNGAHAVDNVERADYATALHNALAPTTESTNLAAGFSLIGQQVSSDEPASVIVLSDGRQTVKDDPAEPVRLLASRGIKVHTLLIGSREVSPDAAVDQIDAPEWIYKDDTLRASARIRLDGLSGRRIKVEFLRGADVLDTQYVAAATKAETQTLAFTDKPPEGPGYEYQVRVEDVPGEINHENNRQTFRVAVKKDKLAVLVIDDQPRWEFRYLAAGLGRDPRVKLQSVLLHPARVENIDRPPPVMASVDNPKVEAQLLPETAAQWQAFDLIVLGDLPPETLNNAQQQYLATAVRDRGATLVVLAGPNHMPDQYAGTPLADLLPVSLGNTWAAGVLQAHMKEGFRLAVAPGGGEGGAAVLARFAADEATNTALWSRVPPWYWHSEQTVAKPGANVVWYIGEPEGRLVGTNDELGDFSLARRRALLSTMTLGLGRVLYLASDQTWRLRQVGGENVQDRFWGQVIRWAAGSDLPAGGRFVRFGTNRPRYQQGDPQDPVQVTAHVLHTDLTPNTGQAIRVVARPMRPGTAPGPIVGSAVMVEAQGGSAPGYYKASLGSLPAGDIELSLEGAEVEHLLADDPSVTQKTIVIKLLPQLDAERRNMNTDPEMLANLAQLGGGLALDGPYADVLAAHLPQISRTLTHVEQIGFFGDPKDRFTYFFHFGFLLLFCVVITTEWAVRKYAGMV